jgi:hypothetical protein
MRIGADGQHDTSCASSYFEFHTNDGIAKLDKTASIRLRNVRSQ